MVAERHGIQLQGIQDFHNRFSVQQVGIRTALEHVAGAEKNRSMRVFRPLADHKGAKFGGAGIAAPLDQGTVKIIDRQQIDADYPRPFFGGCHARPGCQAQHAD